jgi:D-alanine-D-alanine ligase
MGRVVGLTYDVKQEYVFKDGDPPDANAEFDHKDTIGLIEQALIKAGHKVVRIGNVYNLLKNLSRLKVDIVFNIAEGLWGRNRESQVPVILEAKGIPYVGSDGLTLGISLDKFVTKKILMVEDILTPRFMEIKDITQVDGFDLRFPLMVKPRYEGSSKGISQDSLTKDVESMKKRVDWVMRTYKQPALVEEFISGQEFTVAVLGNDPPEVMPVVQISIKGRLNLGETFYTFGHIHSSSLKYICPARVSPGLKKKIEEVALRSYQVLECRDFARVDIRVDEKGRPYVLEINPLPSLSTADVFPLIGKEIGLNYQGMVNRVLNYALKRYGL